MAPDPPDPRWHVTHEIQHTRNIGSSNKSFMQGFSRLSLLETGREC